MNVDEVSKIADRIIRETIHSAKLERVETQAREDHDGDPSLFVTAKYREDSPVPNGAELSAALDGVNQALSDAGETRFAYIYHRFAGPDAAFDDDPVNENLQ